MLLGGGRLQCLCVGFLFLLLFAGSPAFIASQMDTEEATTIITTLSIVVEYIGYLAGLKTSQQSSERD